MCSSTLLGNVWLTGFGMGSQLPHERQAPAPPEIIAGTLAYMAPEQTGRMNRSMDTRSDLYSLGVTFYQMLTGTLPFAAADPLEWVHCHIARQPRGRLIKKYSPRRSRLSSCDCWPRPLRNATRPPRALRPIFGGAWRNSESQGHIEGVRVWARTTSSDRLLIPEKLYGRELEIDGLLAAFDRVMANGTAEFVLVSGYSGVGKSSVVNELHRVLVPPRGLFASGKFDQYKRDIPYTTLAQAFRSLVRPLLGQSEAELGRWQDALRGGAGLERPTHGEPRSRAGARDRKTAARRSVCRRWTRRTDSRWFSGASSACLRGRNTPSRCF